MRGVPFFQVPTTILAQIDSSVGGKVAIDLPGGKNLAGAFYQPKGVFIDPDLLDTLPTRYVHDGLAEALKYGCIGDPELFELLENIGSEEDLRNHMEEIILRSVLQKKKFVEEDRYDNGSRQMLNFGHTIGHAIERYFNYSTYTHGEGVAIGMCLLTEQTERLGITEKERQNASSAPSIISPFRLRSPFPLWNSSRRSCMTRSGAAEKSPSSYWIRSEKLTFSK